MPGDGITLPEELRLDRDGAVAILTMNRPEQFNAANAALHRALLTVWLDLAVDPTVRSVVLTGAGKAFSAGGDLAQTERSQSDEALRTLLLAEAQRIAVEMTAFPKPIVAAVNGPAVGLGFSLAMFCDLVLAAERAFFSDPHLMVGLVAGDGVAMVLPHYTSLMRAKEVIWTGERIDATTAVQLGLASRVVPFEENVLEEAIALAQRLAAVPAQALQDTKRALNLPLRQSLIASLELGLATERQSITSAEHRDVIAAMLARANG